MSILFLLIFIFIYFVQIFDDQSSKRFNSFVRTAMPRQISKINIFCIPDSLTRLSLEPFHFFSVESHSQTRTTHKSNSQSFSYMTPQ